MNQAYLATTANTILHLLRSLVCCSDSGWDCSVFFKVKKASHKHLLISPLPSPHLSTFTYVNTAYTTLVYFKRTCL